MILCIMFSQMWSQMCVYFNNKIYTSHEWWYLHICTFHIYAFVIYIIILYSYVYVIPIYNNSSAGRAGLMYPMVCPFWNFTVVLFFFFTQLLLCRLLLLLHDELQLHQLFFMCLLKIINYCIIYTTYVCIYNSISKQFICKPPATTKNC